MEQGQGAHDDVFAAHGVDVERVDGGVHHQVEVGEHGAFGDARGAAGVEDHRNVVGGAGHVGGQRFAVRHERGQRVGPLRVPDSAHGDVVAVDRGVGEVSEQALGEDEARPGVGEEEGDLLGAEHRGMVTTVPPTARMP